MLKQVEKNKKIKKKVVRLVPFVRCQIYRVVRVNLDPPKGTQRDPGIHIELQANQKATG